MRASTGISRPPFSICGTATRSSTRLAFSMRSAVSAGRTAPARPDGGGPECRHNVPSRAFRRALSAAPGRRAVRGGAAAMALDRTAALASHVAGRFGMDVVAIGGPDNVGEARCVRRPRSGERRSRRIHSGRTRIARERGADRGGVAVRRHGQRAWLTSPRRSACPVVILSGHPHGASPTHPGAPERFGPWADPSRVLVLRTPAHRAPCSDGCEADEPHCILGIEVDDVAGPVERFAKAALKDRA